MAARSLVFLFAFGAALAWDRARPRLALTLFTLGGAWALAYWLVQIASPFGLGTDRWLTRQWAQAGVNAASRESSAGFVWGTPAETSWLPALTALGAPLPIIVVTPQIGLLLCLALLALMPRWSFKNPTTASFAGCLILGGGLWPGWAPYDGLIRSPPSFIAFALAGLLIALAARHRGAVRRFRRHRFGAVGTALAVTAVFKSLEPHNAWSLAAPLLLLCATAALAAPLRAVIRRRLLSSAQTRRAEALVILAAFTGGGLFWWEPVRTVPGFLEAKDKGTALLRPIEWIRENVAPGDVVLASPEYSASIAAFAGRRVLFSVQGNEGSETDLPEPARRTRLYASTLGGAPPARLAEHFSATHLLLGPGEADPAKASMGAVDDEPRLSLALVYRDLKDFRVFRLTKK